MRLLRGEMAKYVMDFRKEEREREKEENALRDGANSRESDVRDRRRTRVTRRARARAPCDAVIDTRCRYTRGSLPRTRRDAIFMEMVLTLKITDAD